MSNYSSYSPSPSRSNHYYSKNTSSVALSPSQDVSLCPLCHASFPNQMLSEHVNQCRMQRERQSDQQRNPRSRDPRTRQSPHQPMHSPMAGGHSYEEIERMQNSFMDNNNSNQPLYPSPVQPKRPSSPTGSVRTQASQKSQYLLDLEEQIEEAKRRKQKEKDEADAYDRKKQREMEEYDPFGRGGCGAPLRNKTGAVVTDLRDAGKDLVTFTPKSKSSAPDTPQSASRRQHASQLQSHWDLEDSRQKADNFSGRRNDRHHRDNEEINYRQQQQQQQQPQRGYNYDDPSRNLNDDFNQVNLNNSMNEWNKNLSDIDTLNDRREQAHMKEYSERNVHGEPHGAEDDVFREPPFNNDQYNNNNMAPPHSSNSVAPGLDMDRLLQVNEELMKENRKLKNDLASSDEYTETLKVRITDLESQLAQATSRLSPQPNTNGSYSQRSVSSSRGGRTRQQPPVTIASPQTQRVSSRGSTLRNAGRNASVHDRQSPTGAGYNNNNNNSSPHPSTMQRLLGENVPPVTSTASGRRPRSNMRNSYDRRSQAPSERPLSSVASQRASHGSAWHR